MSDNVPRFTTPREPGASRAKRCPTPFPSYPFPLPAAASGRRPRSVNPACYRLCFPVPASRPARFHPALRPAQIRAYDTAVCSYTRKTRASWVRRLLDIRVPQDDPSRAHLQGPQRGVPGGSIAVTKLPHLVLIRLGVYCFHAPESGSEHSEASVPPILQLAIPHLEVPLRKCVPTSRSRFEAGHARIVAPAPGAAGKLRSSPDCSGRGEPEASRAPQSVVVRDDIRSALTQTSIRDCLDPYRISPLLEPPTEIPVEGCRATRMCGCAWKSLPALSGHHRKPCDWSLPLEERDRENIADNVGGS